MIEDEYTAERPPETGNKQGEVKKIDLATLQELSNSSRIKLAFEVEEKALDYLSQEFGRIERGVRYRKSNKSVEFDGGISDGGSKEDIIFEVKWARNPDHAFMLVNNFIRQSADLINEYVSITGKRPIFNLVVVTNTKTSISSERLEKFSERAKEAGVNLINLSLKEIGFEVTHDIA